MFIDSSNRAHVFARRDDERQRERVGAIIEAVLTQPTLDESSLALIATRADFAVAVEQLCLRLPKKRELLLPALHSPLWNRDTQVVRVAALFGVVALRGSLPYPNAETVRRIALSHGKRSGDARIALALTGDPVAAWSDAPPAERAAFALHRLVRLWRGGP